MSCDTYVNFVKEEAYKLGYVFILDSGEGRECKDIHEDWYIEDLSGWLILKEREADFSESMLNDTLSKFDQYYVFAQWYKDEQNLLNVRFKKY